MKRLIKGVVDLSKAIATNLERAYDETYACVDYMHEICKRARVIQERNKQFAIETTTSLVIMNTYRDHNFLMPEEQAREIAKVTVEMAREQGLLDIMNEPKEDYNGKLL
jgi:biotin synthase-related radical SAM superfamily protein